MKKAILLVLCFFGILSTYGQASGNTLTVTDVTGNIVYWEYNFSSSAPPSQSGPGAPLNTPIIIKLSSQSGTIPTFIAGDMNGNCDNYQAGSMNAARTSFQTYLSSCCSSIAEVMSDGGRLGISIKCASAGPVDNCVTYNYSTCGPSIYCISFVGATNMPAVCRSRNHPVTLSFTDGTQASIVVNFANNFTTFCYIKPVQGVVSANFGSCCPTGPQPRLQPAPATKEMVLSENDLKKN